MLFLCKTNKNWEIDEVMLSVVILLSKSISGLAVALFGKKKKKVMSKVISLYKDSLRLKCRYDETITLFPVFKRKELEKSVLFYCCFFFCLFAISCDITSAYFLVSHEETQIHINCESVD